jgi:transcription elongation factor Elf1
MLDAMSIVIATLKSHIDYDHTLTIHCGDCQHHVDLDLPEMVKRFGPEYDVVANRSAFLSHFHCSRCGSKNLTLTVAYRYAGKKSEMAREG